MLRSPGSESEESIPPAYVPWRAGTTNVGLSYQPVRLGIDSWAPWKVYKYGLWIRKRESKSQPDTSGESALFHQVRNINDKFISQFPVTYLFFFVMVPKHNFLLFFAKHITSYIANYLIWRLLNWIFCVQYILLGAHKLRARRTVCKSVFFQKI